jgi:hypothetical protein
MRGEYETSGATGPRPYGEQAGNGRDRARGSGNTSRYGEASIDAPALGTALAHAYGAGKRTVADRLALIQLDVRRALSRLTSGGILLGLAAVLLVIAWFTVMVGGVLWMGMMWGTTLSLGVRLLIAAALTAVNGGAFVAAGLRSMRAQSSAAALDRPSEPDAVVRSIPGPSAHRA